MSETDETGYLKCPCKECGNNIEFPASAARDTIACPHCGQWTELVLPHLEKKEAGVRVGLVPLVGGVVLLIAVVAGGVWFSGHKSSAPIQTVAVASKPKAAPTPPPVVKVSQPKPATTPTQTQTAPKPIAQETPKAAPRPKSLDDLKVGPIELEKTKGSSLVYAVGILTNDSEFERYGVRVNLDLLNRSGVKVGTATDYAESLTPHQQLQFHAMVTDPKTITARFSSVKED